MEYKGILRKMSSRFATEVEYGLRVGDHEIAMNSQIGKSFRMIYTGEIFCIRCGRKTSKSFAQGYCFPCFRDAPETEECVLKPELCRAHEGISRDMDYARKHCLIEHVVYLSVTSGLKVGVTRHTQVPTRWIDQGAVKAIELARTPNRFTAGQIEVFLKKHINDKTNWRAMLKNEIRFDGTLEDAKHKFLGILPGKLKEFGVEEDRVTRLNYPVRNYPDKVSSLNLDKAPVINAGLTGIKGQYLIFDDNSVINIRKFGGYEVRFSTIDQDPES